jgi:hypothetical protein
VVQAPYIIQASRFGAASRSLESRYIGRDTTLFPTFSPLLTPLSNGAVVEFPQLYWSLPLKDCLAPPMIHLLLFLFKVSTDYSHHVDVQTPRIFWDIKQKQHQNTLLWINLKISPRWFSRGDTVQDHGFVNLWHVLCLAKCLSCIGTITTNSRNNHFIHADSFSGECRPTSR